MSVKVYSTEEEQIQALTNWFKKYGSKLVIGLFIVTAIVAFWNYRQVQNDNFVASASVLYEKLQKSTNEDEKKSIAKVLSENYQSTIYGKIGKLILANNKAEQKNWAEAATDYKSILDSTNSWPDLQVIVFESWIRTQLELGKAKEAYDNLLSSDKKYNFLKQYPLNFYNLKGDVLHALGENKEAVVAYNQALEFANADPVLMQQAAQFANWISLKRNDLLEAKSLN